uniref:Ammonium transporter n=1 Tax=Geosiphon pyriformis TaxID=50956 RepID=U3LYH9_9GLOM|nr:ammonium transporter 2 [Geosiphon pyriformis]
MADYNSGDISFVLLSTALVWFMIPGVGYFYSGISRQKNALSLIMLSVLSVAVVSFQWFFWGYSLTYGKDSGPYIGNLRNAFLIYVEKIKIGQDSSITDMTFAIYQCMFAAITPALAIGSAAERGRIFPAIFFFFIWSTLVYDPIAHWTWSQDGWGKKLGILDFAGGTPVHISCGAAALAYCLILGKRHQEDHEEFRQHNISHTVLGTVMLWFGWFGFNGGSALAAGPQAVNAYTVTNLSASVGGLTWMAMDFRVERKLSTIGFCCGAIAGLVVITPGAGYVSPSSSIAFGFIGGFFCNLATNIKHWFDFDDAMEVFPVHCVGGIIGNILTGIFAQKSIAALDGRLEIDGGLLDGNWKQIVYQIAGSCAGLAYSFSITYIILFIMDRVPGFSLRVKKENETSGLDKTEIGESAYDFVDEVILLNTRTQRERVQPEPSNQETSINERGVEVVQNRSSAFKEN